MLNEMFSRKHGSRPGVAHICILITDGRSSKPELTEKMAEEAHDSGVYVFSIGNVITCESTQAESVTTGITNQQNSDSPKSNCKEKLDLYVYNSESISQGN